MREGRSLGGGGLSTPFGRTSQHHSYHGWNIQDELQGTNSRAEWRWSILPICNWNKYIASLAGLSYDARRSLCKWISRSSQSSCSRETINRLHLPHACPSIQRINHPITVGPQSWAFQSKLPNCRARLHWTCLKLISIALCQASLLSTELHHVVLHCTLRSTRSDGQRIFTRIKVDWSGLLRCNRN